MSLYSDFTSLFRPSARLQEEKCFFLQENAKNKKMTSKTRRATLIFPVCTQFRAQVGKDVIKVFILSIDLCNCFIISIKQASCCNWESSDMLYTILNKAICIDTAHSSPLHEASFHLVWQHLHNFVDKQTEKNIHLNAHFRGVPDTSVCGPNLGGPKVLEIMTT